MARETGSHPTVVERLGRYEVLGEIAAGGMATVFLGRVTGAKGFQRLVAIKRLHPHLETEEDFVAMFLDEARLAARIRNPNVVATLDVEDQDGLYIVMEYIEGDRLLGLLRHAARTGERIPPPVAMRIALDTLAGLHAAHELADDDGTPLGLVHRDVSPQNVLIGVDGVARLTDFGIAKATSRLTVTRDGQLKGKIAYMAPEQTKRVEIDRRVDIFAMGIIAWEMLTSKKLFTGESDVEVLNQLLFEPIPRVADVVAGLPPALDAAIMKALEREPAMRFGTAAEFADALETACAEYGGVANPRAVAAHLQRVAAEKLAKDRARLMANALPMDASRTGRREVEPSIEPVNETIASMPPLPSTTSPPRLPTGGARPALGKPAPPPARAPMPPLAASARPRTMMGLGAMVPPAGTMPVGAPMNANGVAGLSVDDDDDDVPTQAFTERHAEGDGFDEATRAEMGPPPGMPLVIPSAASAVPSLPAIPAPPMSVPTPSAAPRSSAPPSSPTSAPATLPFGAVPATHSPAAGFARPGAAHPGSQTARLPIAGLPAEPASSGGGRYIAIGVVAIALIGVAAFALRNRLTGPSAVVDPGPVAATTNAAPPPAPAVAAVPSAPSAEPEPAPAPTTPAPVVAAPPPTPEPAPVVVAPPAPLPTPPVAPQVHAAPPTPRSHTPNLAAPHVPHESQHPHNQPSDDPFGEANPYVH